MIYSINPNDALSMPASRFFALLREGRKLKHREDAINWARLCDIGFLSRVEKKSYDKLRESYIVEAMGRRPGRVLEASDPRTANIMRSIFKQAARFTH